MARIGKWRLSQQDTQLQLDLFRELCPLEPEQLLTTVELLSRILSRRMVNGKQWAEDFAFSLSELRAQYRTLTDLPLPGDQ